MILPDSSANMRTKMDQVITSRMYAYAGQQWKTAEKTRFIMHNFYTDNRMVSLVMKSADKCRPGTYCLIRFLSSKFFLGIYVFGSPHLWNLEVYNGDKPNKNFGFLKQNFPFDISIGRCSLLIELPTHKIK